MLTLADADPFPRVLATLQASQAVEALLGAPERVGSDHKAPYPRLRVRPTTGGSEDFEQLRVVQPVRLDVYDSTDTPRGDEALRDILIAAVAELVRLPETTPPGGPAINRVISGTKIQPLPEPDGRNRWFTIVNVHAHPGAAE
ncbi:hypothetical protein ACQP25_45000 (plasmid) [Microtetraspora malaysiensis]|uniref:hypothetical protein n=1 Tax=Microtetraspora malaysiensis TaxID=161358 RepID=UPI003D9031B5